jgi:N-acetylmuramoyl-L-alanine amidase
MLTRVRPSLVRRLSGVLGACALVATLGAGAGDVAAAAARSRPAAHAPLTVEGVRTWTSPASTRVVFDLTARPRHRLTRTADRLVVELADARFAEESLRLPPAQGPLKAVKLAAAGRDLKITFDVAAQTRAQVFSADPNGRYGWRLVVDLKPPAAATPAVAREDAAAEAGAEAARVAPLTQTAPSAAPAAPRRELPPLRDLVIAVDAGHGGVDPGAHGRDGTREKDVTLAIARALAERIDDEPGMRAVLTRDTDQFVELRERIRRARAANADLFVSVHADAVADREVAGSSVYILSQRGASNEAARRLAERENAADLIGGVKLSNKDPVLASVLLDLSQSAAMSASQVAAEKVLEELDQVGTVRKSRVQQAGFVVLKSPDIPSMLIETAYITNPGEERKLRDPRHQRRLAEAILSGVRTYFRENPPPGTRLAALVRPREETAGSSGGGRALNR